MMQRNPAIYCTDARRKHLYQGFSIKTPLSWRDHPYRADAYRLDGKCKDGVWNA